MTNQQLKALCAKLLEQLKERHVISTAEMQSFFSLEKLDPVQALLS
jgi:hypothetical protein